MTTDYDTKKVFCCSVCYRWVPDYQAYRYGGRLYCTDDLPSEGWDEYLEGKKRPRWRLTGDKPWWKS